MQSTIKRTESGKYSASVVIRTENGPQEVAKKTFKTLTTAQEWVDGGWKEIADSEAKQIKPRPFVRNRMSSVAKSSGEVTSSQIGVA